MPEPRVQSDHCGFLAKGDCRVFALKHREEDSQKKKKKNRSENDCEGLRIGLMITYSRMWNFYTIFT